MTAARLAYDRGNRGEALIHIDTALAIDPNFLAAHALRDRLFEWPQPLQHDLAEVSVTAHRLGEPVDEELPLQDSVAFELEHESRSFPWWAAAALVLSIGAAGWLTIRTLKAPASTHSLNELTVEAAAPVAVESSEAVPAATPRAPLAASTSEVRTKPALDLPEVGAIVGAEGPSVANAASAAAAQLPPLERPEPLAPPPLPVAEAPPIIETPPTSVPASLAPSSAPVAEKYVSAARPPWEALVSAPIAPPMPPIDDDGLIRQVLQRYRQAFERLDAVSVSAVYPNLDRPALARAFEGLRSQALSFDACDVEVRASFAMAVCRGSARYVTKVGRPEPRNETRVWNFSLSKTTGDWRIERARVER